MVGRLPFRVPFRSVFRTVKQSSPGKATKKEAAAALEQAGHGIATEQKAGMKTIGSVVI